MSYKILTLNNISVAGLDHFPRDRYAIASSNSVVTGGDSDPGVVSSR